MPYESARVEYGNIEQRDKKNGHIFKRMVQNILKRAKHGHIKRVDINLKQAKNLNSFIGRTAHIKILEDLTLQTLFAYFYTDYLN